MWLKFRNGWTPRGLRRNAKRGFIHTHGYSFNEFKERVLAKVDAVHAARKVPTRGVNITRMREYYETRTVKAAANAVLLDSDWANGEGWFKRP